MGAVEHRVTAHILSAQIGNQTIAREIGRQKQGNKKKVRKPVIQLVTKDQCLPLRKIAVVRKHPKLKHSENSSSTETNRESNQLAGNEPLKSNNTECSVDEDGSVIASECAKLLQSALVLQPPASCQDNPVPIKKALRDIQNSMVYYI